MAFGHGSLAVVKLDDGSGSLVDITSYINSGEMQRMVDKVESTVLGLTAKTFVPGLKDCSFSIEGFFEPTLDGILDAAFGSATTRTLEFYPQGTATGKVKYSFECFCTDYPIPFDTESLVGYSADFQCSGNVTRAIV